MHERERERERRIIMTPRAAGTIDPRSMILIGANYTVLARAREEEMDERGARAHRRA